MMIEHASISYEELDRLISIEIAAEAVVRLTTPPGIAPDNTELGLALGALQRAVGARPRKDAARGE